jgi:hypothetical protein
MNYKRAKEKWFKKNVFSFGMSKSGEQLFYCDSKNIEVRRDVRQAFEVFGGKFNAETFFKARAYAIKKSRSIIDCTTYPSYTLIWDQKCSYENLMDFQTYRTNKVKYKYSLRDEE